MGIYITENGLEENIPFTCTEHELYSIYDKLPTCLEAGTMHEECMHCDYLGESIEIPASEEYHQWVITETTTESTCSSHGTGSAECSVCGETTASLPLDSNKHTKWNEEAGICDDCHNYYNEPTNLVAEAWSLGGFNKNFNSAEDFNVTINLNTKLSTNLGVTMYQAFVGDICSIGWANGGISINSGASSWGAWGDKTDYLRVLNNKFGSGLDSDLVEAYKDADVELNVDRSTESNRITLNAIVTSNVEGYEDGFAQILLIGGKTTNRNGITVTIGAEKANVTFYSAYLNEGKLL